MASRILPEQLPRFVGELIFRTEGEVVDRRLKYTGSGQLHQEAEEAHITHLGIEPDLARDAVAVLLENAGLLYACRADAFRKASS